MVSGSVAELNSDSAWPIHNERKVLACRLRHGARTDEIDGSMFTIRTHRTIYDAADDIEGQGLTPTPEAIIKVVSYAGGDVQAVSQTLEEIASESARPDMFTIYTGQLVEYSERREMEWTLTEAQSLLRSRAPLDEIRSRILSGAERTTGRLSQMDAPISVRDLVTANPVMRKPVIDGILRQGENGCIHAKSKAGKSWLSYGIALDVVCGYHWLGRFRCEPGRVLLLDFELHQATLADRIPKVARAKHLRPEDYEENFHVKSFRGKLRSLPDMASFFKSLEREFYSLIVIDPLYRVLPAGMSENDNAAMAQVFNMLDEYAESTGAAILMIHHQSKGLQSDKDVVDVGSGAGTLSRAPDAHIVMRPHEEANTVVLEAALRSFAPIEPVALRWDWPLWKMAEGVDPTLLKGRKTRSEECESSRNREGLEKITTAFAKSDSDTLTRGALRKATGMYAGRLDKLLASMVEDGSLEHTGTVTLPNKTVSDVFKLTG